MLRVALADRPGALGAVASRIGSVRGDVVAVEIVERGGGRAVDEFVVELADEANLPLLLSEIAEVDGVEVQEAHPISGGLRDRSLDAYDTALLIVSQRSPQEVMEALTTRALQELDAQWSAVVDVEQQTIVASQGPAPAASWIADRIDHSGRGESEEESFELGWVELAARNLALVVCRPGWSWAHRERDRMGALARLADACWVDVSECEARANATAADELPDVRDCCR